MSFYRRKLKEKSKVSGIYKKVVVYLPASLEAIVRTKALETNMPMSRLIAIAVDNEMDAVEPFHYPCEMPDDINELDYVTEGGKLYRFIKNNYGIEYATTLQSLILTRRDLNMSRETVGIALRAALKSNNIVEVRNKNTRFQPSAIRYQVYDPAAVKEKQLARNVDSQDDE